MTDQETIADKILDVTIPEIVPLKERVSNLEGNISSLITEIHGFVQKFDTNKDGKLSIEEVKALLKNPLSKRYFLVFLVIFVNISVAIFQFYVFSKGIDVGTLVTLLVSCSTVLFGGWIENANTSVIQLKDEEIDKLKTQQTEAYRNSIDKDSKIKILENELQHYKNQLQPK